jgi:hypothetical protein
MRNFQGQLEVSVCVSYYNIEGSIKARRMLPRLDGREYEG